MKVIDSPLEDRILYAKSVDFGTVLGGSFDLFKKVWLEGFYHALISLGLVILFIPLVYVPLAPFYIDALGGFEDAYREPEYSSFFEGFTTIYWIGYVFFALFLGVLINAVNLSVIAHFYRVVRKADTGTGPDPGGYLDDLRNNFKKLMLIALAIIGISILAYMLCFLPIFYVIVPLQLLIPLYAFNREESVSDLLSASFKLGNKFWLTVFGLIIISQFFAQLGGLLCGIGLFFTVNFVHLPIYLFYKHSVGFDQS